MRETIFEDKVLLSAVGLSPPVVWCHCAVQPPSTGMAAPAREERERVNGRRRPYAGSQPVLIMYISVRCGSHDGHCIDAVSCSSAHEIWLRMSTLRDTAQTVHTHP
jgi:hypothetical protein